MTIDIQSTVEAIPETALAWHVSGKGAILATVVETWGSAPRRVGGQLVVSAEGEIEGSVSGGCVEGAVIFEAMDALETGKSKLLDYGVSDGDAFAIGFIIQRHVARHDGRIERDTSLPDAIERTYELAHDLGLFGIAKVQVVGGRQRLGANRGQVAISLGHCLFAALDRVRFDITRGYVAAKGDHLGRADHVQSLVAGEALSKLTHGEVFFLGKLQDTRATAL